MADDARIKLERDDDIMKFINIGEEMSSDLELSEDGGSSVASSVEFKLDPSDNYEFDGGEFDYNWMPVGGSLGDDLLDRNVFGTNTMDNQLDMSSSNHEAGPIHHDQQIQVASSAPGAPGYMAHGMSSRAQDLMQRIKFGAFDNPGYPFNPPSPESTLFDFDPSKSPNLPYSLHVDEFPLRSRVETQIKCRLTFRRNGTNDLPSEALLHLPSDTIARPRFQLMKPEQLENDEMLKQQTLWLSVEAINPDLPREQVLMCSKCLARERRRAFRKKAMDPHEETYWNGLQARRIIIFNCREVVPINTDGQVELPLRIACYCRHHAAKNGYQLLFALRNHQGQLLGRTLSSRVFITDSHKDQRRVSSTQNQVSPSVSNPATPSSVSSSQDSLPLTSSHMRRASSASSLGVQAAVAATQTQQSPHPQQHSQYPQHSQMLQHQHHPYMRPSKPSSSSSSSALASMSQQTNSGFQQLPSSQLTRQIQKLHAVPSWLAGVQLNDASQSPAHHQQQQQQPQSMQQASGPTIFRVIPHTGSVRGGVEVTLLGQNFQPGMVALFGDAQSINTQCWSDSTIIAQLPPSSQPGPVPVTFQDELASASSPPMFTYVQDGEDKLKEIALQMVGYKVTGKIEDAADIAQRIVMNDNQREQRQGGSANGNSGATNNTTLSSATPTSGRSENPTDSAEQLALWVLHNLNKIGPGRMANVNLRNSEGQSMIHIASMLGYASVVKALIASGAYVDIQDVSGYTPLHFAVLFGNRNITRLLLMADADPFHRTLNGLTALDLTDVTVEDLLPKDQRAWYNELNRRGSSSSIASMIQEWRQEVPGAPLLTPDHSDGELNHFAASDPDALSDHVAFRKPPSYSQLFPADGAQDSYSSTNDDGATDISAANVSGRARGSSVKSATSPGLRRVGGAQVPVIDIEVSSSEDDDGEDGLYEENENPDQLHDADDEADDNDDIEHHNKQLETKRVVKGQEIWNDKMLFTFWIPLSLFTILGITAIYIIQNYGSSEAHPLATIAGDKVAKFCSWAMDRIMPFPRWNQTPPAHVPRPAK